MKVRIKVIAYLGLLIALDIVITRFCSIQSPDSASWRIGFGFVPLSITGQLFGPIWGMVHGLISDFVGAIAFPKGPFFYGYTLSNIMRGLIYGLFLYKCSDRKLGIVVRCVLCALCVAIFVDLGMNSYWDTMLRGIPFEVNVYTKLVSASINFVIRIATMPFYVMFVKKYIKKNLR